MSSFRPYTLNSLYVFPWLAQVGRGVAKAILDLFQLNPWSRIPSCEFGSLAALRSSLARKVQFQRAKQAAIAAGKKFDQR